MGGALSFYAGEAYLLVRICIVFLSSLQAVKYPKMAYWFMQSLLGKDMDQPQVKAFQERFPYYTIERDYQTGMPIFVHDE